MGFTKPELDEVEKRLNLAMTAAPEWKPIFELPLECIAEIRRLQDENETLKKSKK